MSAREWISKGIDAVGFAGLGVFALGMVALIAGGAGAGALFGIGMLGLMASAATVIADLMANVVFGPDAKQDAAEPVQSAAPEQPAKSFFSRTLGRAFHKASHPLYSLKNASAVVWAAASRSRLRQVDFHAPNITSALLPPSPSRPRSAGGPSGLRCAG